MNPIGIGWAGPTLLYGGTPEQQQRYLPPILAGEEFWCQLFSEPQSGSGHLANLAYPPCAMATSGSSTGKTLDVRSAVRQVRDPDRPYRYRTWRSTRGSRTSSARWTRPGIEIRPITEMTGGHTFNEVFFTDVRIPAENLVGREGDGWRLAKVTLGNERISLSTGGVLWGNGPTALDFLAALRRRGPVTDPELRQRVAGVYIEHTILDLIRMRTLSAKLKGEQPGPEASIRKILGDEHGQHVMNLVKDLLVRKGCWTGSASGFVPGTDTRDLGPGRPPLDIADPGWHDGFLFSAALTVGGGTGEGAAQHRRRAGARPSPRHRRDRRPELVGRTAGDGAVTAPASTTPVDAARALDALSASTRRKVRSCAACRPRWRRRYATPVCSGSACRRCTAGRSAIR